MHGIFKSGLIARLSGAPLRAGFAKEFTRELNHLFFEPPNCPRSKQPDQGRKELGPSFRPRPLFLTPARSPRYADFPRFGRKRAKSPRALSSWACRSKGRAYPRHSPQPVRLKTGPLQSLAFGVLCQACGHAAQEPRRIHRHCIRAWGGQRGR